MLRRHEMSKHRVLTKRECRGWRYRLVRWLLRHHLVKQSHPEIQKCDALKLPVSPNIGEAPLNVNEIGEPVLRKATNCLGETSFDYFRGVVSNVLIHIDRVLETEPAPLSQTIRIN